MAKINRSCDYSFEDTCDDTIQVKARMLSTPELIDYQGSISAIEEKKEGMTTAQHGRAIVELMVAFVMSVAKDITGLEDESGAIKWSKLSEDGKEETLLLLQVDDISKFVSTYFEKVGELKGVHSGKSKPSSKTA